MDPPPLSIAPPISAATPTAAQPSHISYPNSVDSSPRSRTAEFWDELNAVGGGPPTGKLRLMCSYGGHIIPRPHDKTLCYIGGDTRIMVVDRHTTLADLHNRLSKTLLNNKPFTLKYQLPNEDLDSLISVTTDEDLENMIDEYDRLFANSGLKLTSYQASKPGDLAKASPSPSPSRLRLFLFPLKSESTTSSVRSIESLLESSTKSEDWFLDALNGNMRQSAKFSSDSSSVNCLLGLEDHGKDSKDDKNQIGNGNSVSNNNPNSNNNNNGVNNVQDVHSVPDSPMLETTSSFGSTSSSPSMANLPPIRVHVEDSGQGQKLGGLGIEEQFQQMSMGVSVGASPPAPVVGQVISGMPPITGGGEYVNRVFSDDERSEQGLPVGYRKVQQGQVHVQMHQQPLQHPLAQQQPAPLQQKPSASAVELPSPDSVSSEGSVTNPLSRQRQMAYQEQMMQIQSANNRASSNLVDPKLSDPNNNRVQMQQLVQESEYVMQGQFDQHPQLHQQQQFVHAGVQYIHHPHAPGGMPIASYYPVYPPQPQHHPHHPTVEQQFVYYMPARQAQAYNMPVQPQNYSESPNAPPSSRPQTPPSATIVDPSAAYNPGMNVPGASKNEMAPGIYRTSAAGGPHLVQVHSSQHPPQFVGYSQMHHQSAPQPSGATPNYAYQYPDPAHAQIYYTQPIAPQLAAQYHQNVTPASGMVLPGTSQVPTETINPQHRQQNSSSSQA